MNTFQPIYILSAEKTAFTPELNAARTEFLKQHLEALCVPYKRLEGKFKGQLEVSFMIYQTENDLERIERLARDFDQEAYMFSDSNRYTTLHVMKGDTYHVGFAGILRATSKEYAEKQAGHTFDGENYYILD